MSCIFPTCNDKYSNLTSCRETTHSKFPTDPSLRTAWLVALNRAGWQPDDESTVCSKHFLSQDMERTGTGLVIREGAVPVVCVKVCRICLAGNCKLYTITSYKTLQQAYETLTGLTIQSEHYLPACLCNKCAHQLLLFTHFRNKSLTTHSTLLDIYTKHKCITTDSLNSIQGIQGPVEINQAILYDIDKEIAELENMDSNKRTEMLVSSLNKEVIVDCVKLENDEDISHDAADVEALTNDAMVYISKESMQEYTTEDSVKAENHDIINQIIDDTPGNTCRSMDDGKWLDEDRPNAEQNTYGELEASTVQQNLNHLEDHAYSRQKSEGKTIDDSLQSRDESEMDRQGNTGLQEFTDPVEDIIHSTPDKLAETEDDTDETLPEEDVINAKENSTEVEVTKVQEALIPIEDSTHRRPDTEDSYIGEYSSDDTLPLGEVGLEDMPMTTGVHNVRSVTQVTVNKSTKVDTDVLKGECRKSQLFCDKCSFETTSKIQMASHVKAHSAPNSYNCSLCSYKTVHKRSLAWHASVHSAAKPYPCDSCNKTFSYKASLRVHLRKHSGKKPYSCNVCDRRFSDSSTLRKHSIIHTGKKPYSCDLCTKTFRQVGHLKSHLRMHSDERPFICDLCNKAFRQKSHLNKHMPVHFSYLKYACDICDKKFRHNITLQRHVSKHSSKESHSCKVCKKVFSQRSCLRVHLKKHLD